MAISNSVQASWRKAAIRGCGLVVAAVVLLCNAANAQVFTLTLQPNNVPAGTENTAYSQMITAVGGNAPYTFAVTAGSLPTGITLAPGGLLSGTPTTPGSSNFTITATDIDGNTGFRPYTFSIGTQGGLTINPGSLPNGTQGVAYNQSVAAAGGSGGYVYSISAGSLPPGLSLNSAPARSPAHRPPAGPSISRCSRVTATATPARAPTPSTSSFRSWSIRPACRMAPPALPTARP